VLGFRGDEGGVELGDAAGREHGDAIFVALAGAHDDLIALEVDILDAQGEALVDAQATAVEEQGDEVVDAGELVEHLLNLVSGEDGWQAPAFSSAEHVDGFVDGQFEDVAVKEQDGVQCLVLGGRRHVTCNGEVGEEGFHLVIAHGGRMGCAPLEWRLIFGKSSVH
jgi:hypothetical protein